MKKEEKELFKGLCNFKTGNLDESLLEYATPSVLGHLFFNRMQAIAYGTLKERGMLRNVNREFRNSLKAAYEQNKEKNQSFFWCIQHLKSILSECGCNYAMLKGAFLCRYYPDGYRTSNDIDLLVLPEHVTAIGIALLNAGFRQGNIRNGKFLPATRREIIESKMMRGETVPYIKEIKLPSMKYLEVDINFSLDYKNGDTKALEKILERVQNREVGRMSVPTLDCADFFIHLCSHLYKEATTLPWIEMKRDMTLYKYCDIYLLLSEMTEGQVKIVFERAKSLGMEEIVAFTMLQTASLFDVNSKFISMAEDILSDKPEFIHLVISPKEQKTFVYEEKDIFERFFAESRKKLLKEVTESCKN